MLNALCYFVAILENAFLAALLMGWLGSFGARTLWAHETRVKNPLGENSFP